MTKQEFIKLAIKNGYDDDGCKGWDWIRENLKELDYIFQTEEYKEQDGMKYKCMPFLIEKNELKELEIRVLETAWYLNNDRVYAEKKRAKVKKLNDNGFFTIEDDKKLDKKKIEFVIDNSDEMFGGINKFIGKLVWSIADERLMAMKSRCRRRGHWITDKVYVKFI